LKSLNNDKDYTQISWQSFITDLQPNFNLSALSNEFKQNIVDNEKSITNNQDISSSSINNNQMSYVNSSSKLDLDNENETVAENQCYKSTSFSSLIVLNRNNKRRKTFNEDEQVLTENLIIKGAAIHQRVTKTFNNNLSYFNSTASSSNNFSNNNSSVSLFSSSNNILNKKQSSSHNLSSSNHHHSHHKNDILNFNWDDYFEKNHKISTNQNFRLSSLQPSNMSNLSNNQNSNGGINLASIQYETNNEINENNNNNESSGVSSASSFPQSHLLSKKRFNYNLNSYKERFHPYLPNSLSSNKNKDDIFNLININTSILTNNINNTNNNNTVLNSNTNANMNNLIIDSKLEQDILDRKYLVYDVQIDYDLLEIWKHGLSVISYDPINLKSACFICASVGHEYQVSSCDLIICNSIDRFKLVIKFLI
jgi:hypothetical protein